MFKYNLFLTFLLIFTCYMTTEAQQLPSQLQTYCQQVSLEFDQIPAERKANLQKIANYVQAKKRKRADIQLTFICTHNSRRSQFGQVWAKVASSYYKIAKVQTFSGGTEATACNIRTIKALQRAGVPIEAQNEISAPAQVANNPRYAVLITPRTEPMYLFSKVYDDSTNPAANFCAILVCSQADEACPMVYGAEERIYHGYEDPKRSDDTPQENAIYDQTCRQIAREMLYVFSLVR